MINFYKERTANYPRNFTDTFFADYRNSFAFTDITEKTAKFIEENQVNDPFRWKVFVDQFRQDPAADSDYAWRGEYWGKMMRGACLVYSYTKNPELYSTLAFAVKDMMSTQDAYGRISAYPIGDELTGWDMWSRKYVLLGMQYFLEICEDEELYQQVITSMCRQVDYIMTKIGPESEGKKRIVKATRHWRGMNSSSVLEPIVRLYSLTGKQEYLDFANYIAGEGGTSIENLFRLAEAKQLKLYQYPATKAYEMTSCFEGLLELYRVTGEEWYKTAVINFGDLILEDDFTVIGCCGCTHELFDGSKYRQANTTNFHIMQETCVTVTLMKFFYQLNLLTGDPKYIDAFERSYYNAYLGSVNTDKVIDKNSGYGQELPEVKLPLPFFSYNPLTASIKGIAIGGYQETKGEGGGYYGCCACIGSAGIGLAPKAALLTAKDGLTLNLFFAGEFNTALLSGNPVNIKIDTCFPACGKVTVTVNPEKAEEFTLYVRNPEWSRTTSLAVNGQALSAVPGYIAITRTWQAGDTVSIALDMNTYAIRPFPYGSMVLMNKQVSVEGDLTSVIPNYDEEDPLAKYHIALQRGPIMLAQEARLGYSLDTPISVEETDGVVAVESYKGDLPYEALVAVTVPLKNGEKMLVTDYASAGKPANETAKTAVWFLTEDCK